MEGMHCFNPASGCDMSGLTLPIVEYDHTEGEAVMGGFVYRGTAIPTLVGSYIFGDYISGTVWQLKEAPAGTWTAPSFSPPDATSVRSGRMSPERSMWSITAGVC